MKGKIMWIALGLIVICFLIFGAYEALHAVELVDQHNMYKYLPPEPNWKDVQTENEYVRYTDQCRERKVAELHLVLWKAEEALEKAKPRSIQRDKIKELYNQVLGDILDYNSPVLPYTPNIESFNNLQKAYENCKDKSKFTTKKQIKEWVLADGKHTTFKGVIGAITPKRIVFLSPNDKQIVVAYSRMAKTNRVILHSEHILQQKRSAAMRVENGMRRSSFQPYSQVR